MKNYPIQKSEAQWLEELGPERYRILREKGTERAFTGAYNMHKENGSYQCGACNETLFESSNKFDSGCGWPSFDESISGKVEYIRDTTHGMIRTEILCANCGSHLGHVFNDGPRKTTGKRHCINGDALIFEPTSEK